MENDSPSKFSNPLITFILGLLLAFGLCFFLSQKQEPKSPIKTHAPILKLEVFSPTVQTATSDKKLSVTGTTGVKAIVTIVGPSDSKIINSGNENFSTDFDLTEGKNVLEITAFDPTTGNSQHTIREVLYLDEDLSVL